MAIRGLALVLLGGLVLGGCMQSTIEPASEANLTTRDKKLLAAAPYEKATIAEPYRRHIVEYHRKELPGTIVIDSDARYLYYVLDGGKAIRYGVTVGEEALAWQGVAKVGRKTEWPSWTPTAEIKKRMDVPDFVGPGPQQSLHNFDMAVAHGRVQRGLPRILVRSINLGTAIYKSLHYVHIPH